MQPHSPTPAQHFSSLLTLLLNPYHGPKYATHPALLDKVFALFQDIICFLNGCKWSLTLVCHPTYYSSTITFQGLSFLEDQITASNMADRWHDPTIQSAPESYQFLDLVHNLFTTLSSLACNLLQSSFLLTMITVPYPSFLI